MISILSKTKPDKPKITTFDWNRLLESIRSECSGYDQSLMFLMGLNYEKFHTQYKAGELLEITSKIQKKISSSGVSSPQARRIFRNLYTQTTPREVLDLSYFLEPKKKHISKPVTATRPTLRNNPSYTRISQKSNKGGYKPLYSMKAREEKLKTYYRGIKTSKAAGPRKLRASKESKTPQKSKVTTLGSKSSFQSKPSQEVRILSETKVLSKHNCITEEKSENEEAKTGPSSRYQEEEKIDTTSRKIQPLDLLDPFKDDKDVQSEEAKIPISSESNFRDCPICFSKIEMKNLAFIECGHMYHIECLQMYIKTQVDVKSFPIKCPLKECHARIPDFDVKEICEKDLYQKYERFQFESFIDSNSQFYHHCPTPDCSYIFEWDANKDPSKLSCPSCSKVHCLKCKVPWHEGWTCEKYSKIKEASPDDQMFYKLANETKFQQCSQCKFWVQKKEGCDHITCRCGYEFCYICGGKHQECDCGE
ncbi:unnamed protein product [Moneuplotes crassus]|uniref:RBR-type E3 ubiquitin transferase n=1 Tax=Euplotes crassus TaxID=5936 RepID=A0AAD1UE85_EUPCR|nr:unnamed protein product [Moneuplotes crassus]